MSKMKRNTWMTEWTAKNPLNIGFIDAPAVSGSWVKGKRPHLECRDLGLAGATNTKMGAQHIRALGATREIPGGWQCHDVDFHFFYVLKGWIKLEMEDGETFTLTAGDSGCLPPLHWYRDVLSNDYEMVEITAPSRFETIEGRDTPLPPRARKLDPSRKPIITRESPEAYKLGTGPRSYLEYRDLGTRQSTQERIHIQIIRATGEPGEGTGWHYHSSAEWFMMLRGISDVRIETRPRRTLKVGDAMCIGAGPNMRHNLAPFSGDHTVLLMCIPSEYDTIPVDRPEGAAD